MPVLTEHHTEVLCEYWSDCVLTSDIICCSSEVSGHRLLLEFLLDRSDGSVVGTEVEVALVFVLAVEL